MTPISLWRPQVSSDTQPFPPRSDWDISSRNSRGSSSQTSRVSSETLSLGGPLFPQ